MERITLEWLHKRLAEQFHCVKVGGELIPRTLLQSNLTTQVTISDQEPIENLLFPAMQLLTLRKEAFRLYRDQLPELPLSDAEADRELLARGAALYDHLMAAAALRTVAELTGAVETTAAAFLNAARLAVHKDAPPQAVALSLSKELHVLNEHCALEVFLRDAKRWPYGEKVYRWARLQMERQSMPLVDTGIMGCVCRVGVGLGGALMDVSIVKGVPLRYPMGNTRIATDAIDLSDAPTRRPI